MNLSYFELLSPYPVYIKNVGRIISPTLKDISSIGYDIYQYYLSILTMDLKRYLSEISMIEKYNLLTDEEKSKISIYDMLILNKETLELLLSILNFFIKEDVLYSSDNHCFIIKENNNVIGNITRDNYSQICDLICQRNCIKSKVNEDLSKIKSKKALEIMKKLQKGRNEKTKQTKLDKNMELGNIISSVANRSKTLNILNIWELTIFQLYDCFSRLSNNNIYDIQSISVAVWGDKDNHFDATSWFNKIDTDY